MANPYRSRLAGMAWAIATLLVMGDAHAINIAINFVPGYFGSHPTSQATILKAATDVSQAITSNLSPVNQDYFEVPVGNSTVTFDWAYQYKHPTTGAMVAVDPGYAPANTVTVWVGDHNITEGNTLGTGSGATLSLQYGASWSGNSILSDFAPAVAQLNALSEAEYRRGAGAFNRRRATLALDVNGTNVSAQLDVDVGVAYGSVQLDVDTNNDGFTDAASTLNNYWHLDYQTPVAAGKRDLYSVMVHELLHVLGVGASDSWNSQAGGGSWFGSHVIDEHGTGTGLVSGSHIAEGVMSRRITDGAPQEAALDPTITTGTRKYLTTLDLAFLRDLGYTTIMPEFGITGDYNGDGVVDAADYTLWRNTVGSNTNLAADGNNNNVIDAGDYAVWRANFGQVASAASSLPLAAVPEPAAKALAIVAGIPLWGWWLAARRRSTQARASGSTFAQ